MLEMVVYSKEFQPEVSTLWDVREYNFDATNIDFFNRINDIRKLFPSRGKAKVAIVVDSDLGFGMGRVFEQLSEVNSFPQKIKIFRKLEKAEQWLIGEADY